MLEINEKLGCSKNVTHIVTEFTCFDQVEKALNYPDLSEITVVTTKWLTSSIKSGYFVYLNSDYILKGMSSKQTKVKKEDSRKYDDASGYACQRITLLDYKNKKIVQALEVLAKRHEYQDKDEDYPKALAFSKAAAALKSLTFKISSLSDLKNVKDVGKHSKKVIQEILENGISSEVEDIVHSDWYKSMEIFNAIFGVGPSTANKWYKLGYRTVKHLQKALLKEKLEPRIRFGIAFYDDLSNTPVTTAQAEDICKFIYKEANLILPKTTVDIAGGFRRGKETGHDVDLILSHPKEGAEVKLLEELHEKLQEDGYLLYSHIHKNTFNKHSLRSEVRPLKVGNMDHFEKCFCIFKYIPSKKGECKKINKDNDESFDSTLESLLSLSRSPRDWLACRVDLILTPASQYAYCMLGWTGNKHFARTIRDYAKKELNMKLTSHGLWDYNKDKSLPAKSEKEIFDHLQLIYREPWERNC